MAKFERIRNQVKCPLFEGKDYVTGSAEHIALSRRAATEGMVLLKNEDKILPLKKGQKIALFGQASVNYIKGGGGSGEVYCAYIRNVYEGLEIKEKEGKVSIFPGLRELYEKHVEKEKARCQKLFDDEYPEVCKISDSIEREIAFGQLRVKTAIPEADIPEELMREAAAFTDTAIIVINRYSGEAWDRGSNKGDFYLSDSEEALVESVKKNFKNCIAVLDVGGMVDSAWFINEDKIGACLLAWQAGMEGGLAIADILCGDANPSGKLVDTFAKGFNDYPSSARFNESHDYIDYDEDIYVGYRYFETIPGAANKVNYPFGFGLSYTDFEISNIDLSENNGVITANLDVKNMGDTAGKEVVQIYFGAPEGKLGKPAKSLVAFKKTDLLAAGETQKLTISFKVSDMASFDDLGKIQKSAFVLEKGEYVFYVGNSVRNTVKADFVYSVENDTVTEQLHSYCAPVQLKERMLSDGSFEKLPLGEAKHIFAENAPITAKAPENVVPFDAVGEDITLDEFIAQFTDRELCEFMGGDPSIGVANTGCFSGLDRLSVPHVPTADGPAGLRLGAHHGIPTTAWPCATLIACSWNEELMEEIGRAGGLEVKENNISVWLTPALNIHRNPLCGRNFEYFSEDPLIAGKMAAAKVRGMQSVGTACSIKHFAANNKEINRIASDSRVSERALREIYLKGFEICVKESNPLTVMTSYNVINGIHTSESYELLMGILRGEWGFDGMVTTDWGVKNNPVYEVKAGNDMKMHMGYPDDLEAALKSGELTRADLEACAKRILNVYLKLA